MNKQLKKTTLSLSIGLALAGMAGAYADEPAAAAAPAEAAQPAEGATGDKPVLQIVTVNAEKEKGFKSKYVQVGAFRDQLLLDAPFTVNIIPRAVLEAQDAQGIFDALKNSAGVARSQTSGTMNDSLAIRGISVEARTNYRLNGSLPVINLIDLPMENKERVEALKGSSALYYGFSSPAGIVNLVTKRATTAPVTSVAVNGNEYGQLVGAVDIGRKFGADGQFGIRVNAAGGQLRNATKGAKADRTFGAVALDWRVNEDLTFRFDAEDIRKDAIENGGIGLLPAVNNTIALPPIQDQRKLISGPWAHYDAKAQNFLLRTDYTINDSWAATFELGRAETQRMRRSFGQMQNYNIATGEGNLRVQFVRGQVYVNENARLELTGRVDLLVDHELTVGVMQNKRDQNAPSVTTAFLRQNMYNPRELTPPVLPDTVTFNPQAVKDQGIYFFDKMRLTPTWSLLVGARNSDYTNKTVNAVYQVKKTSPSAGVVWKVRPDTSIYATYLEGVEETGIAPAATVNAFEALPPAVSKTKELGVRTEGWAGITASAAYFQIDRASAYTNAANRFVLDGRAHYSGLEFSLNGAITPEVQAYVSGMFLDAEQRNAVNPQLIGKIPENTAKATGSVFLEYKPAYLAGFSVNAGAYYTGKRAVNNENQAFIPGYTIFTAGLRYATKLGGYPASVQVNVENLGNKNYWSATGGALLASGMPRTVKFSAKMDF
ncbi:TonB-dependent siderophore receptor [Pseudoduganella namucuonensis]|uniref:Iron complex outermembrane recepter protein n=1 Tax=Pseudoduganella namucuonensis TaxID=1035707 RepID=A0A1I7KT32_9BURK|nr:TonB-dependent siderophore receptor [Pseudoduganella namucuonensis]SFV00580.1 iron complex outermembrane recepter protein [Pseudoduganella namucuonensis]